MTPACSEQHLRTQCIDFQAFLSAPWRNNQKTLQHHLLRDAIQAQHPLYDLASGYRKGGGVRICGNVWELRLDNLDNLDNLDRCASMQRICSPMGPVLFICSKSLLHIMCGCFFRICVFGVVAYDHAVWAWPPKERALPGGWNTLNQHQSSPVILSTLKASHLIL